MTHHGFLRVAAASPVLRVADCAFNAERILALMARAESEGVAVLVFPGTVADRLHLRRPVPADRPPARRPRRPGTPCQGRAPTPSRGLAVVGLPLAVDDQLFNCAAVLHRGRRARPSCPSRSSPITRSFTRAAGSPPPPPPAAARSSCTAQRVPFGTDRLFDATDVEGLIARRRDLRGPVGADPAQLVPGAGRRHGAASTCRPATRSSARPPIAGSWSSTSPAAAWPPTSTPPAASGNRPPTWSSAATA